MADNYPLVRALEIIGSINLNAMSAGEAFYYAQKTAKKGLAQYNSPPLPQPKVKLQLLEDMNDGRQLPSGNER